MIADVSEVVPQHPPHGPFFRKEAAESESSHAGWGHLTSPDPQGVRPLAFGIRHSDIHLVRSNCAGIANPSTHGGVTALLDPHAPEVRCLDDPEGGGGLWDRLGGGGWADACDRRHGPSAPPPPPLQPPRRPSPGWSCWPRGVPSCRTRPPLGSKPSAGLTALISMTLRLVFVQVNSWRHWGRGLGPPCSAEGGGWRGGGEHRSVPLCPGILWGSLRT